MQFSQRWLWYLGVGVLAAFLVYWFAQETSPTVSLGELAKQIALDEVARIYVKGDELTIDYKDNYQATAVSEKEPSISVYDTLRSLGVTMEQLKGVDIRVSSETPWLVLPVWLLVFLLPLFLIGLVIVIRKTVAQQTLEHMQPKIDCTPENVKITLEHLGGMDKVKEVLQPILKWLRTPDKELGGDLPRGVLITGPSGVGKTSLARAIAGESECPLFVYNGAQFAELLVGMGSVRMRNAFKQVREHASQNDNKPVIMFIDQLELVASEHSGALPEIAGGQSEANRTLAVLLKELDDLEANRRVYVLGASRRPHLIDPAVLAPGRLSLRLNLPLPDERERRQIIEKLTRSTKLAGDVEALLSRVAHGTATFSSAELVQLVEWAREAAAERVGKETNPGDTETQEPDITKDDFARAKARLLPQPREELPNSIYSYLDRRVTGQESAKKRLAVVVSNHYLRLREAVRLDADTTEIEKANVLMVGPTGTGKTMLIEEIATFLQVPHVIFNATILTETGHVGASVEQMLYKLISAADYHLRKAEFGIVCIDEIDKLAFHQGERTRQTGAGVQQELLKLVEGTIVDVPKAFGERTQRGDHYQFDTSNILFVCLGAFNGVEKVVAQRLGLWSGANAQGSKMLDRIQPEDVISYGFIPELIGRFPVVTVTRELTEDELKTILNNDENGLLRGYKHLLGIQGYEPRFTRDAIRRIASEAACRKVGARGLRTIMEEVLLKPMYERVSAANFSDLRIDKAWIDRVFSVTIGNGVETVETVDEVIESFGDKGCHENAKEILAVTSFAHYRKQARQREAKTQQSDPVKYFPEPRHGVLLVDPHTHQRVQLVETLATTWHVPLASRRADHLERALNQGGAPEGWLQGLISSLLFQSNYDLEQARRGILFIDDFDLAISRVTMDPFYDLLTHQILELLRGRPLPLQTADGRVLEVATDRLFLVLGGDFRFSTGQGEGFIGSFDDSTWLAKYNHERLIGNLQQEFNIGSELLQHLYVALMDLKLDQNNLEDIIRRHDESVRKKYGPFVAHHGKTLNKSDKDYERLASQALEERWPPEEIFARLEEMLVTELHRKEATHVDA